MPTAQFLFSMVSLTTALIAQAGDTNMALSTAKPFRAGVNDHYGFTIPVNQAAPVVASATIEIQAPVERVWQVLTDIENWPEWQRAVTEATLRGSLAAGSEFIWRAGGLTFHSRLHTVVPNQVVGWTGKTMGVSAIHNWQLSHQNGVTTVAVSENLSGFLPWLLRKKFRRDLEAGMAKNLAELKAASEAGTQPSTTTP